MTLLEEAMETPGHTFVTFRRAMGRNTFNAELYYGRYAQKWGICPSQASDEIYIYHKRQDFSLEQIQSGLFQPKQYTSDALRERISRKYNQTH